MQIGVGAKFGFWLSLLGLIAIGSTALYAYSEARAMLMVTAKQRLVTTTTVLGRRFTVAVDQVARDLALMTRLEEVGELAGDAENPDLLRTRLADIFEATLQLHPEYLQLRLIGARDFGRELVRVDRTDDGTARVTGTALQEKGHFPYLYRTLSQPAGSFYLSKINLNRERGVRFGLNKPTVRLAIPVYPTRGEVFGMVIVNVDLNILFTQLRADLPGEMELYLTNAEGDYLIHPDSTQTFGFDRGRRLRIQQHIPETTAVLQGESPNIVLETGDRVAVFVDVPFGEIAPDRRVLLGLTVPTHTAARGIASFAERLVLLVSAFSVLAIILSFILSKLLVRPLHRVMAGLDQFSRGLPLDALPTDRNDEMGMLSRSFESMANQIGTQLETLRLNEQNLHRILESAPSGMAITSRTEPRILFMNTSARARFQIQGSQRVLHPLEDGLGSKRARELYLEFDRSGSIEYSEHRLRDNMGAEFWALLSMVEIEYQDQAAILISIVDISQRKAAELELNRYRNDLEALVEERTAALVVAQRESLRNERLAAIGQLTGTVSHELRNPLGTIHSSFTLLRRLLGSDDPRVGRALERIDRNVSRCDRIVQDLLDYARTRDITLEPTHLDRWMEQLLDEEELPDAIRIERSLSSGARISIDRHRLAQAVMNVIQNACQAMSEAEPATEKATLGVRSRRLGDRIEIEIEDNGPGIDPGTQERIFEPLFSTRPFGVGLGLPLVKQIMDLHGGGIEVHSAAPTGTRITLWLPSNN